MTKFIVEHSLTRKWPKAQRLAQGTCRANSLTIMLSCRSRTSKRIIQVVSLFAQLLTSVISFLFCFRVQLNLDSISGVSIKKHNRLTDYYETSQWHKLFFSPLSWNFHYSITLTFWIEKWCKLLLSAFLFDLLSKFRSPRKTSIICEVRLMTTLRSHQQQL